MTGVIILRFIYIFNRDFCLEVSKALSFLLRIKPPAKSPALFRDSAGREL